MRSADDNADQTLALKPPIAGANIRKPHVKIFAGRGMQTTAITKKGPTTLKRCQKAIVIARTCYKRLAGLFMNAGIFLCGRIFMDFIAQSRTMGGAEH